MTLLSTTRLPFSLSRDNASNTATGGANTSASVMLARALAAVASSEAMPGWRTYRAEVERSRCRFDSTEQVPSAMLEELRKLGSRAEPSGGAGARGLSWSSGAPIVPARLTAALASFVDDYGGPFPREFFPEEAVRALLNELRERAPASLTIPRQFALAVGATGNLLSAVVLLHATLRWLARGRDARAYPTMAPMSIAERVRAGASVAPFRPEESPDGDPLGDAYHYWAMVAAGMFRSRIASEAARALFGALFWSAPWLMSAVRRGIFRRTLFYGNHATVDRLGLSHGIALSSDVAPRTA